MTANRLYFSQHGLAVDKEENSDRPLSEKGINQTSAVAKHISDKHLTIDHIFHSGKTRASQTADIFERHLKTSAVYSMEHLSPNDSVTLITKNLDVDNALYIGHLPHLNKLVSYLVTGEENNNIIQFQNSAITCLEKTGDSYQITWYLTPDLL